MLDIARRRLAGDADQQTLHALQHELNQQRQSYESLSKQLDEAHKQAYYAAEDAELWQEAYSQTVEAELERVNGELLHRNRQLQEDVAQATRHGEYSLSVPEVSPCTV